MSAQHHADQAPHDAWPPMLESHACLQPAAAWPHRAEYRQRRSRRIASSLMWSSPRTRLSLDTTGKTTSASSSWLVGRRFGAFRWLAGRKSRWLSANESATMCAADANLCHQLIESHQQRTRRRLPDWVSLLLIRPDQVAVRAKSVGLCWPKQTSAASAKIHLLLRKSRWSHTATNERALQYAYYRQLWGDPMPT